MRHRRSIPKLGVKTAHRKAMMSNMATSLINHGQIITIDIASKKGRPRHDRIAYILGSSTADEIVAQVQELIKGSKTVMVILDSDHTMQHVIQELRIYSKLVTLNSYLIVEDTNMNGHPVAPEFGPGPMEAVDEFLKDIYS